VGGSDNNLSSGMSNSNFTAGITFFGEFTGEEFGQFSVKHAVGHKLSSLADGRHLDQRRGQSNPMLEKTGVVTFLYQV
jgi:hypothetical protein